MARNDAIPDDHDLVRWIKAKFVGKNDDGDVELDLHGHPTFVFPQAFELREDEDYLSVTSADIFPGDRTERILATALAIESSTESGRLSRKSALAVGLAGRLRQDCFEFGHSVRILEEPEESNVGHVAVRRYPREVPELFELLADECFRERHIISALLD